jgi:hypothetical protein
VQTFDEELWLFWIDEVCRRTLERKKEVALATGRSHARRAETEDDCETLCKRGATRWTKYTAYAEQELSGAVSRLEGELSQASEGEIAELRALVDDRAMVMARLEGEAAGLAATGGRL